ncbi:hydrolase [Bacillus pumilus]|uniref:hydrolase n=1 Tax=Bacillus pumilus TaxID=1408 RepID=UPI002282DA25|nr:hydrolase [Bacillus pumilus]MCY9674590.1 hydrolase [Bacillus pumilus]
MTRHTYYVSVQDGSISQHRDAAAWQFQIEADDDQIYFDEQYMTDWKGFFRAHVPYLEYHYDSPNDEMDRKRKEIYSMIFELGNEETKNFIETNGLMN